MAKRCSDCQQSPCMGGGGPGSCTGGSGGGSTRRSRKKGTPRRKPGEVMIAAHSANWALLAEMKTGGRWVSKWVCTICSREKNSVSDRQNDRPASENHPATISQ